MKFNTKQGVLLASVLLCISVLFASCGASNGSAGGDARMEAPAADMVEDAAEYDVEYSLAENEIGSAVASVQSSGALQSERIIYSAEANIETAEFDAAIESVYAMLDRYNAFIETSYIGGRGSYYGRKSYRSASFTLRVPKQSFTAMTDGLSDIGNLLSFSSNAVNISTQYVDTESRLNAYKVEESRLLDMLSNVNDVEAMIALESRLSNVRYEMESLTSRLRDWQSQVDYSTVNLNIEEVEKMQEQTQLNRSYAQELGDGFGNTLRGVGVFFKELFRLIVAVLPVLIILAVIALAVLFIVKKARAGAKANTAQPNEGGGTNEYNNTNEGGRVN
ncbi:MAG: DUF4349 domain-containing protein [Clostridiales Family XIII bacterium]|jgi:hypothetical protein|nr:DUF4349 domain-containing protein [Clostridiales Family XIII bacterium]